MQEILSDHAIPLSMLLMGHATQILMRMIDCRKQGCAKTLREYLAGRPYATVLALLGSLAGYFMLADTGQLTAVAAWGVGFAADKMVETLSSRSERVR